MADPAGVMPEIVEAVTKTQIPLAMLLIGAAVAAHVIGAKRTLDRILESEVIPTAELPPPVSPGDELPPTPMLPAGPVTPPSPQGPQQPPPTPPTASSAGPEFPESIRRYPIIENAAKQLADAEIMTPQEYYALEQQVRGQAFTISGDLTDKTIEKVQGILAENIAEGPDRKKFAEDVAAAFEADKLPISDAHLEQVFRNVVNGSLSDGSEDALHAPIVEDAFPYRSYFATTDERVRDEHMALEKLGLNGTNVFRSDDPVWRLFRPPWSWNCRCGWSPVTVEQAAKAGVKEAQDWLQRALDTGLDLWQVAPVERAWVSMPPFSPPAEWSRA